MKINKEAVYRGLVLIMFALCSMFYYSYRWQPIHARNVSVFYNHDTEANQQVIKSIQQANHFVYFSIYTFTREDIKDALLGAKYRGLIVEGIVDRQQLEKIDAQRKIIKQLRDAGIPIAEQDHSGIMHLKAVVTDQGYVSGSYNWTAAATTINDEIIEVGHDEDIRRQYQTAIQKILKKYSK